MEERWVRLVEDAAVLVTLEGGEVYRVAHVVVSFIERIDVALAGTHLKQQPAEQLRLEELRAGLVCLLGGERVRASGRPPKYEDFELCHEDKPLAPNWWAEWQRTDAAARETERGKQLVAIELPLEAAEAACGHARALAMVTKPKRDYPMRWRMHTDGMHKALGAAARALLDARTKPAACDEPTARFLAPRFIQAADRGGRIRDHLDDLLANPPEWARAPT